MKHRVAGRRLDRTTEHRTAMFRNMVTSLITHERIVTTTPKAKELKRIADKIITLAKKGGTHARRLAFRDVRDGEALAKLFETIGPRFATRAGGYTRVVRVENRVGDNAQMAMIELVERTPAAPAEGEKAGGKGEKAAGKGEKAKAATKGEKPAGKEKKKASGKKTEAAKAEAKE
jgi:large subunit ribosomal protein L17